MHAAFCPVPLSLDLPVLCPWGESGARLGQMTLPDPCLLPTVIMVAHFLQSLTQRLVLGGELVYHRRPGEEGAILTLAGKYSGN